MTSINVPPGSRLMKSAGRIKLALLENREITLRSCNPVEASECARFVASCSGTRFFAEAHGVKHGTRAWLGDDQKGCEILTSVGDDRDDDVADFVETPSVEECPDQDRPREIKLISRSKFVRSEPTALGWLAGLWVALGVPTATSETIDHNVSAPAPTKRMSARAGAVVLASAAGAALDSSLVTGGGTDDTAALQAALNQASGDKPVHLLIDGVALVSGLNVHGNTTVECTAGSGLYLKDNSVRSILRNVHRSREAITDQHITVRGCTLNGNRAHQIGAPGEAYESGGTTHREPDRTYISGLQFFGVRYLTIENTIVRNIRTFGIWVANAQYIHLSNVVVDNGMPADLTQISDAEKERIAMEYLHTDGVHFGGPIRYLTADGLTLRTGDDALAFIANYDGVTDAGPYVEQGPITDVTVSNVVLVDALLGIRMLSTRQRIDRIVIENVVGTVRARMALLGHFIVPTHTGNFGSITFSHVNVDAMKHPWPRKSIEKSAEELSKDPSILKTQREYWEQNKTADWGSESEYSLFSLNSPIESLNLRNIVTRVIDGRPLIRVGADAEIRALRVDVTAVDPELQARPLKFVKGGHVGQLNVSLDWAGTEQDVGKNPILNEGGVIDRLHWVDTPPAYVSAKMLPSDPRVIAVDFSQRVKASHFGAGVNIEVNSRSARIVNADLQPGGEVVRYRIDTPVHEEDAVTWAYSAAEGHIQNWDGDNMLSVAPKKVTVIH